MLVCPACGAEELIEGVDLCDQCHQPLTDLSIRVPRSSVEASLLRDTVSAIPVHAPVELAPETPVGDALRTMVDRGIGCVLVVDQGNLVGIFSERDALMRLGAEAASLAGEPLSRFMTPNPETVAASEKIAFALHKMDLGGYRHLPVMEEGHPVSLISIRDLLRYLTEHHHA